jgi:signal transduction histidine kinase
MKNMQLIQNELFLKEKSLVVVQSMEDYNTNNKYFNYPRFQSLTSGLYSKDLNPIFTLIESDIKQFKRGYSTDSDTAYYMIDLPKDRYFKASYLILSSKISFAGVYKDAALILISIAVLVFSLSLFFLNRFSLPFREMNTKLDSFIKDSMHEINTPLSIININIDLFSRKNEPNKYLSRIKAASKVLSGIYNDMDYLIKHDKLDFDDEIINLSTFLLERIEYFMEVATMKNIFIKHEIKNEIFIMMNKKQLQLLLDNSISNSIKYSYEKGTVEIKLKNNDEIAILGFKDYGVGISNIDKIFERYYRENKQKSGFGIGLSIVSSIIQKYNIQVKIDSELKKGSTFTYSIPTC